MSGDPTVEIVAHEGMLFITPPIDALLDDLKFWSMKPKIEEVTYFDKRKGETVTIQKMSGYTGTYEYLYTVSEEQDYVVVNEGLFHRVTEILLANGFQYSYRRTEPLPEFRLSASTVAPMWSNETQTLLPMRPEQIQAVLHLLSASGCGQVGAAGTPRPGSAGALANLTMSTGKTFLIAAIIRAFQDHEIIVTTYRTSVVRRLYDGLNEILGPEGIEVGMVTGHGRNKKRVTVCTDAMLQDFDPDTVRVILYDECHRAGADGTSRDLLEFKKAVKFGFSGTIKKHPREKYIESLFGPIAYEFDDQAAEDLDRVSKLKCYALSVPEGIEDLRDNNCAKERKVITKNPIRNRLIGEVAARVPADMQFIIYVRTIEHIEVLTQGIKSPKGKLLTPPVLPPGYEIYHADLPEKEKKRIEAGIYDGSILRLVSNSSFSEGVDTTKLRVLLNADWTVSDQTVSQRAGRNRRKDEGKNIGILIDFRDDWMELARRRRLAEKKAAGEIPAEDDPDEKCDPLFTKARNRLKRYSDRGWPIVKVDSPNVIDFEEVRSAIQDDLPLFPESTPN